MTEQQSHYLLIYSALVALSLLLEAIAIVIVALAVSKLLKQITALTIEAKGKVYPLLETAHSIAIKGDAIAKSAQGIIADAQPKIQRITTNFADTSDVYRAKVAQVDDLITDTATKARRQSDRVDGIVTDALTRTSTVAASVQHAVTAPVRQVSAFLSGAKTTIEELVHQYSSKSTPKVPKPAAFEGESIYTGLEDDYHA